MARTAADQVRRTHGVRVLDNTTSLSLEKGRRWSREGTPDRRVVVRSLGGLVVASGWPLVLAE